MRERKVLTQNGSRQIPEDNKDNIFVRFGTQLEPMQGLSLEDYAEQYNLIAFDQGDAELTASQLILSGGKTETVQLYFNTSGKQYAPSMIAFPNGKAVLVSEENLGNRKNKVYANFKYSPRDLRIKARYVENDPYTNRELMGHCFAAALSCLFACNPNLRQNMKKPTIVMVGRPASQEWERCEVEYAQILGQYTGEYLPGFKIAIVAIGESCAAMAGALGMENWFRKVAQILDLGSSTFDSFTITPKGVPKNAADSYQFGGRDLDRAIEFYSDHCFSKKFPPEKGYSFGTPYGKTAALRFKKEQCYGPLGKSEYASHYEYKVYQKKNGKLTAVIDEDTADEATYSFSVNRKNMDKICNNQIGPENAVSPLAGLYCEAEHRANNAFHNAESFASWLDACAYVMEQFYQGSKEHYTEVSGSRKVPGQLILSGGVANMPEVRALAEKIFGIRCDVAEDPKFTVCTGLARILGSEIRKVWLMQGVEAEIKQFLPSKDEIRNAIVLAACSSYLNCCEQSIRKWVNSASDPTLRSCIKCLQDGIPDNHFVGPAITKMFADKDINNSIRTHVENKLNELIPNAAKNFSFQPDDSCFDDLPPTPLNLASYSPHYYCFFFDVRNCPDVPDLDRKYDAQQRKEMLQVFRDNRSILLAGGILDYGSKGQLKVPSLRSTLEAQISEDAMKPYLEIIAERLKVEIRKAVERMTSYLSI